MLDREQIIEIVVSVSTVALMLGVMIGIGSQYGDEQGTLPAEGGELLVGAIVGFIFLMLAVGIALAYVMNEPGDGLDSDDETETDAGSAI